METINFHDGTALRIGPGEAGFMGAQAVHSHVTADDRLPAAAALLVILALATLAVFSRCGPRPRVDSGYGSP